MWNQRLFSLLCLLGTACWNFQPCACPWRHRSKRAVQALFSLMHRLSGKVTVIPFFLIAHAFKKASFRMGNQGADAKGFHLLVVIYQYPPKYQRED